MDKQAIIDIAYVLLKKRGNTINQGGEADLGGGCLMDKELAEEHMDMYLDLQRINDVELAEDFNLLDKCFRDLADKHKLESPC